MNVGDFEIVNTIICDDVRREDNGKEILIGIYGSAMLVSKFPAAVSPVLWMQVRPMKSGELRFSIRLKNEADAVFHEISGGVNVDAPGEMGAVSTPPAPIQVNAEMQLVFEMKQEGGEWTKVREIPVKKQQPPPMN
jgi:hypothetical protein